MNPATPTRLRRFLDPEVVSRLENMELIARMVVEGFIAGLHRSPFHGFSVEFSEYRPYNPGEPVSRVDYAAALAHHAGLGHISLPTTTIAESGMTRPANVVLDSSLAASIGIECRSLREALSA